ncbi:MAG TPA: type II toxin-antitoxin system VapC family toxin [Dehalococcoidia bacterium]|nr:type II toxin-antitoxin system VapC family toxin [Dehalococcoidia bacterium]
MAAVYFDTSALVRRYDQTEPAGWEALCDTSAANRILVSRIDSVEMASALNGKLRMGTIDAHRRDELWTVFLSHRHRQYRNQLLDAATLAEAELLTFRRALRAYDAIHLATALRAAPLVADLAGPLRFCTADRRQAEAAEAEGLDAHTVNACLLLT